MEPWLSWAIVLGSAALAWWYYSTDKKSQATRPRSNTGPEPAPVAKPTKKEQRAQRKPASTTSSDIGEKVAAIPAIVKSAVYNATDSDRDDASNKLFATQLSSARKGTNLSVPSRDSNRVKTVKTSKINSDPESSAGSSTGADADDDLTPAASPALRAGDVSDMLELKKDGPSILRLTEDPTAMPKRAPRPQKEFQVAETKKQRQNRKKNEERKSAVQETEGERQALLEKQRRTAREARGEPAKNGLQQAKAPSQSAWTGKHEGATVASTPSSRVDSGSYAGVDTKDEAATQAVPSSETSTNGANGHHETAASLTGTDVTLNASGNDDGWATVATKKGKKQQTTSKEAGTKPALQVPAAKGAQVANGFASLQTDE